MIPLETKSRHGTIFTIMLQKKWRMNRVAAALAALVLLLSYFSCLNAGSSEPKIIGGFEVNESTAFGPLQESTVAITDSFNLFRGRSFCSGTLIASNTVVTAAHCFTETGGQEKQGQWYVYFGNRVGKDGTMNARQVVSIARHPNYDHALTISPLRQTKNAYDIALLKFSGDAPEGYKPANVASSQQALPSSMILAGYGTTGTLLKSPDERIIRGRDGAPISASDSGTLRAVAVKLGRTFDRGGVFFVTSPDGSPKGACPGDSGGPAYFRFGDKWFVGGALSTGLSGYVDLNGDGQVDANCLGQNLYTDLRIYSDWISRTLKQFGETAQPSDSKDLPIGSGTNESEPTEHASTLTAGSVYWLARELKKQFLMNSSLIRLHHYNGTAKELRDCRAVVVVDSERPFRIWILRLKDTFITTQVSLLQPGKVAEFTFSLDELAQWKSRTYTNISATLVCSGKVVPTEVTFSESSEFTPTQLVEPFE